MAIGDGTDYSDQSTEIQKEGSMWATILGSVAGGIFGNKGTTTTDTSNDDTTLYLLGGFGLIIFLIVVVLAVIASGRR